MNGPNSKTRHFIDIDAFDKAGLRDLLERSKRLKERRKGLPKGSPDPDGMPLSGRVLAMIFEKPSTRTRVSFDVGMRQLGGQTMLLNAGDLQLGRGESVADTARVLSRYVDAIMLRTTRHDHLMELSANSTVPVINGLTNKSHPCQILADVMTFEEARGDIAGRTIAWSGDGDNNVVTSWIHAAARLGFTFRVASPRELSPGADVMAWAKANGAKVEVTDDPHAAVDGAHAVITDTWVSMHDTDGERRHNLLAPYRVDNRLMKRAAGDAVFLHCLPAKRGQEVTAEVIDGPQSLVWDEAENRLHAQKGVLTWCLS